MINLIRWIKQNATSALAGLMLIFFCSSVYAIELSVIDSLLDEGVGYTRQGNFDRALQKFNEMLLLEPKHPEAFFRIGVVHINQKKVSEGIKYIKKSIELDKNNVRYSLYLGQLYEKQNEEEKAIAEYERMLASGTADKRIKDIEKRMSLITGKQLARKNELNAALLIYNGLLLEFPDDFDVLYGIGAMYLLLNRVEEAELTYRRLFQISPNNVLVNLNLATIFERTGRSQEAMEYYENIITSDASKEMVTNARIKHGVIRGRLLLADKQWNEAMKVFRSVAEIDPTNTEAYMNIALAFASSGNFKEAEIAFKKVLLINENDLAARTNLGGVYLATGEFEKARAEFLTIIEQDKTGRYASEAKKRMNAMHSQIAESALRSGKVEESLKEYQKALDFYSGDIKASFQRGLIFMQQKKLDDAVLEFENVVRHSPDNVHARLNLAKLFEDMNRHMDAAIQYRAVIDIGPGGREEAVARNKWEVAHARGLVKDNKFTEAEAIFQNLIQARGDDPEIYFFLAGVQRAKGKLREAAASYQKLLDMNAKIYLVRMSLANIYEQLQLDELAAREYRTLIFAARADKNTIAQAEDRLRIVESRLNGFTNSLGYTIEFDNNLNLNNARPLKDFRTDLSLNFRYGLQLKDSAFNLSLSPVHSTYHVNPSDLMRVDSRLFYRSGPLEDNWYVDIARIDMQGLLEGLPYSQSNAVRLGQNRRMFYPAFLNMAPPGFEGEEIPTEIRNSLSINYISTLQAPRVKSIRGSISLSAKQNLFYGIGAEASYELAANRSIVNIENTDRLSFVDPNSNLPVFGEVTITYASKDYEYNSHAFSLRISKVLAPGTVGELFSNLTYQGYINPDTGAAADNKSQTRTNVILNMLARVNYEFIKDVRFFVHGSWTGNYSNLATGITRAVRDEDSRQEGRQAISSFQSTSLGNYTRLNMA
ncbi:MAG: tetratricopeptide repeat protein, partial [Gammaproteobacteria bacterium]|nr:tetratricopeptide repeat protein [Gammaproteobacteria bacterium]